MLSRKQKLPAKSTDNPDPNKTPVQQAQASGTPKSKQKNPLFLPEDDHIEPPATLIAKTRSRGQKSAGNEVDLSTSPKKKAKVPVDNANDGDLSDRSTNTINNELEILKQRVALLHDAQTKKTSPPQTVGTRRSVRVAGVGSTDSSTVLSDSPDVDVKDISDSRPLSSSKGNTRGQTKPGPKSSDLKSKLATAVTTSMVQTSLVPVNSQGDVHVMHSKVLGMDKVLTNQDVGFPFNWEPSAIACNQKDAPNLPLYVYIRS
ncbi:hypothetical protein BT96DRAFT_999517 [Gymnopus androsaceus JB14]|uniref:Uncharacterized protein n=1 Tax=Gymnopus androsaceus JB14 TaxID=1447944 RepID=A0A6A4H810_9AGAR|nr:hypothetical protein BT96DRAFT_999517 [Gymnopus androsaceus JB14]